MKDDLDRYNAQTERLAVVLMIVVVVAIIAFLIGIYFFAWGFWTLAKVI